MADAPAPWDLPPAPWDSPSVKPATAPWDQVGQTFDDITNKNHPQHAANGLEAGIVGVANSPLMRGIQGNFETGLMGGPLGQVARASLQSADEQALRAQYSGPELQSRLNDLNQRYNQAMIATRQQGQQEADQSRVGMAAPGTAQTFPQHLERAGQQVLNLAATTMANPELLLAPEMSVGGNIATRIATAAGGNALLAGGVDAGDQLADMSHGMQKNYNFGQTAENAAGGAILGGAIHGLGEATPFVKSLFGGRGSDTTPIDDPRIMDPQARSKDYNAIMQQGSPETINTVVNRGLGGNIAPEDIQSWTDHRDTYGVDPRAMPTEPDWNGINRQAVKDHVNNQTANWKNAPPIEVVHGPEDIADPVVRQQAIAADQGPAQGAPGFFGSDGQVRMYSGRIPDTDTANALLYHEGLGHFGLSEQFGDKLDATIGNLLDRNVSQFSKDTDKWQADHPGMYGGDRVRAGEEVLAERSEAGQLQPTLKGAVVTAVRQFGRKMGLDLGYNDTEVSHILSMAHDAVINGTDARGNGFAGATPDPSSPNKFMQAPTNEPIDNAPKFMLRKTAASPDYVSDDLDRVYKALDDSGYEKETITNKETMRQAMEVGFKPSQIRDLHETNPGELTTKLARIQSAANMLDGKLTELNERIGTPDQTVKDQLDYVKAIADFQYMVARVKGERSELARALQISKAAASYNNATMEEIAQVLRDHDSGLASLVDDPNRFKSLSQLVKQLMQQKNPAGVQSVIKGLNKPYWEQYLTTLWHNSMLSSLATHFKSTLDMINGIGLDAQERLLAMPIDKLRSVFGQSAKTTPQEALSYSYGALRSMANMETYKASWEALKSGQGSFVQPNGAKTPTNQNTFGTIQNPRFTGLTSVINKPLDAIAAQDTMMRSWAMGGHLYDLAMQEAEKQLGKNGSWDDKATLRDTLAHNPTPTMIKTAMARTEHTLLMNNNPLNTMVDKGRIYTPGMSVNQRTSTFLLNTITPFIRVESNNLWSRFVMRSPLGILDGGTRADIMAAMQKGATRDQIQAGNLAIARMTYGTLKMALYWNAAALGVKLTTHGPDNTDKRLQMEAGGWSPDSVNQNGRYEASQGLNTSFNPVDMHNNTASMVASMHEALDKGMAKSNIGIGLKLALGSIMHDLATQSWANDIGPTVEAALETGGTPGEKFAKVATNEATNFYPNALTQTAHLMDPSKHDINAKDQMGNADITGTIGNTLAARIPGMTNSVPIKYSVYGTPLQNGASITGVRTPLAFSGVQGNNTKATTDPAEQELDRLNDKTATALVTPVLHTVTLDDGTKKQLNPAEFEEYQHKAGRYTVDTVRNYMNSSSWQTMSDDDKIALVKQIQTDMKANAREELFNK